MSRFIYNFILMLLFPLVMGRMFIRSIKQPAYRERIRERMGWINNCQHDKVIWVHAVSVGEVLAAAPLIKALQKQYDQYHLFVTTTTPTGSAQLLNLFGDTVSHSYMPFDMPESVRRFLHSIHPAIAIIMETEIWPNLFLECRQRNIPILLSNARLSEKSARGYQRIRMIIRPALHSINKIAAQSESDAKRFMQLGVDQDKIEVIGSIKFDLAIPASLREQAEALRRQLGHSRHIWIAASTHEGEDEQILNAYTQVNVSIPNLLLILVPRHPDRFERVAALCEKRQFNLVRRSSGQLCDEHTQVYLGDTMGELLLLYAAADIAFVGGSLIEHGGHNLLEPAALGVPAIVGPSMYNFAEITKRLLEANGVTQVNDASLLAANTEMLLRDSTLRHQMGENARLFVEHNRGSLDRLLKLIDQMMPNA